VDDDPRAAGLGWQRLQRELGLDEPGEQPPEEEMFQTIEGFDGVGCLDSDNPSGVRAWARAGAAADDRAGYFGRLWTWLSIACATWPAEDAGRYAGPWDARTAGPVLVVGTRYDPATRYESAEALSETLPASRLLTLDGYGHTAIAQSGCIDEAVGRYLVDAVLPDEGRVCSPDRGPFDPPPEVTTAAEERRAAARQEVVSNLPSSVRR
jgi:pimeloyl-ACP methyl ester carboxylesterase